MRGPNQIANLQQEEQEGEFGEIMSTYRAIENLREKIGEQRQYIAELHAISEDHDNRIEINHDQWDTIALLCDQQEEMKRKLNNLKNEEQLKKDYDKLRRNMFAFCTIASIIVIVGFFK